MAIYKVNKNLSRQSQLDLLNDMVLELNGGEESGRFDVNELDDLYAALGLSRKFVRNVSLGHTTSNYTDWSHLRAETGYSIWKLTPTSYSYSALNQLYLDGKIIENRGSAAAESQSTFTSVFFFDGDASSGGGAYTNNTTEAGTESGTEFSLNNTTADYIYCGITASTFSGVKFEFQTRGANYTLDVQYWNGSAWTSLSTTTNNLEDNTSNFVSDGSITWDIPGGWATTSVNSTTAYWVRIKTTTTPSTVAKAYLVVPTTSVPGLLALSSTQVLQEEWAWCSFSGAIYVTIRNTGAAAYEGNTFITSSSTSTNLQNYFVYNHEFTLDHLSSAWTSSTPEFSMHSGQSLVVGDVVAISTSGSYTARYANAGSSTTPAVGIVTYVSGTTCRIRNHGIVKNVRTVGAGNIVIGDQVYLSSTNGKVIRATSSGYSVFQSIGRAVTNESSSLVDVYVDIQDNAPLA